MLVKDLFAAKQSLMAATLSEEMEQLASRVKEYAVETTLSTLHKRVVISSAISQTEKESVCSLVQYDRKSASTWPSSGMTQTPTLAFTISR